MSKPRIEFKSLKLHDDMSDETQCYSAIIVVDGVAAIAASNQGQGGGDNYHPVDSDDASIKAFDTAMDKLEAYAKTLPPLPSEYFPKGLEMDVELLVSQLIDAEQLKKDEKKFIRELSKKIFMIDSGKLYTVKQVLTGALHKKLLVDYPGAEILNLLPVTEAWKKAKPFIAGTP
jgi:hypothetical protein